MTRTDEGKSKHTAFRIDPTMRNQIDELSRDFGISRTEVLRAALSAVTAMKHCATADAAAMLTVLRDRYGPVEVSAWLTAGDNGEPVAHVAVDGQEPADLLAYASPEAIRPGTRSIFLELIDGRGMAVLPIGSEALLVRPHFPIGELPWPAKPLRIVLDLANVEPEVSEAAAKPEPVEA
jgi:hypothetical protein